MIHSYLCAFLFFLSALRSVGGTQINRTIDDQFGDSVTGAKVQYLPTSFNGGLVWKTSSNCGDCAIVPDSSKAFNNTWTSATYYSSLDHISAGFNFQGECCSLKIL